jgi:hypothetical protein
MAGCSPAPPAARRPAVSYTTPRVQWSSAGRYVARSPSEGLADCPRALPPILATVLDEKSVARGRSSGEPALFMTAEILRLSAWPRWRWRLFRRGVLPELDRTRWGLRRG